MTRKPTWPLPGFFPAALVFSARIVTLKKNQTLFLRGHSVDFLPFVLSGELKAVRAQSDGAECIMVRGMAGEFFAESALAAPHFVCDGIALCSSKVALLPAETLRQALREDGDFALAFSLALARQARKQCSRYERLRLKRARDRVLHYLACEGGEAGCAALAGSLADLAAELALEPETLYRTIAELESEGRVERADHCLKLRPDSPQIPAKA